MPRKTRRRPKSPILDPVIHLVRNERVIIDADLARIYHVETKALNRAIKRNAAKFPRDFRFQLTAREYDSLRCQSGTSKRSRGGRRYLPYVFTEHGAIMAANVLNSPRAVQMSIFVVRAFIKIRTAFRDTRNLARQLAKLEQELTARLDTHESAIVDVLRRIMALLTPPPNPPEPPKKEMGFHTNLKSPGKQH